ncbi:hypothetical protein [Candidatus Epulonipiscium viviparus]|nr:hypothetical protein [Candidatus Epulopiscium viviparus]
MTKQVKKNRSYDVNWAGYSLRLAKKYSKLLSLTRNALVENVNK